MTKVTLTTPIDAHLLDDAQRLVDAGEFDSLRELVAEAMAALIHRYEMADAAVAQQQIAARIVQGMSAHLDPQAREQFEEFVAAYVSVAPDPPTDDDMVSLLEIFSAFGFTDALAALHDAQHSKVRLTPRYLMMILEKATPVPTNGHAGRVAAIKSETSTSVRARFSTDNPLLADVATLYQKAIGELTETVGEQLKALVEEFPDLERWHEAFDAAAGMNKRSLRYVVGCLRGNGQKPEPKGTKKRGVSKSEQHRTEKRKRNKEYDRYWDEKLKARQKSRATRQP